MKKSCFLFLLCCSILTSLSGQVPPPPLIPPSTGGEIWVPYNDHGSWGYCDTLGVVTIRPAYESAGFFFTKILDGKRQQVSSVNTKWGENLLSQEGALILPKKLDIIRSIYTQERPNSLFLVKKKGKYGIYRLGEDWLVPAKYDSMATSQYVNPGWILLKRKKSATYDYFEQTSLAMQPSDIVKVGRYRQGYNSVELGESTDGIHYLLKGFQLTPLSAKEFASNYQSELGADYFEEVPEDWRSSYDWLSDRPGVGDLEVDRILEYRDYSNLPFATKYGFQKVMIVEKDGQMGLLNEKGEEILPLAYDKVSFTQDNTQAILEKDGKVGRKVLFTHYPTIEPRYDELRPAHQIQVKNGWSFALFQVTINGQKGYVGENALEYFDLE